MFLIHFLDCSIGYPVVTLGFGFKSYVGFRMRQRKQREVSKENDFYLQLLQQALPVEQTQPSQLETPCAEKSSKALENGSIPNGTVHNHAPQQQPSVAKSNHRKSLDKGTSNGDDAKEKKHINGSISTGDIDYLEKPGSVNDFDENEVDKDKSSKGSLKSNSAKWSQVKENSVNSQRERKNKANRESPIVEAPPVPQKDEHCIK